MTKIRNSRDHMSGTRTWIRAAGWLGGIIVLLVLASVLYLKLSSTDVVPEEKFAIIPPESVAALQTAAQQVVVPEEPEEAEDPPIQQGFVVRGDTAGSILQNWLPFAEASSVINSCQSVYSLSKIRAGQPYTAFKEEGALARFEYEIDDSQRLVVCKEENNWVATVEPIEYEHRLEKVEAEISGSLFATMSRVGETPILAVRIAEIFAWEINFIRDVKPGDSFRVLVQKRYRDGEFKGYGKVLAAEFVNQRSQFEAFLHEETYGDSYFNAGGDSLKRAFLKAPLSFTRISSGFNLTRRHPIFNTIRPHPAVDYAAPSGTPVKAIASGEVEFKGWDKGAGNYIRLKHSRGYESMYLHLSGFAKNLQKGLKVKQGDVIGYVGSTGYSTGPHLDFRMKKDGKFINPQATLSPRDDAVPKKQLAAFKAKRDLYRDYLNGKKALTDYTFTKD